MAQQRYAVVIDGVVARRYTERAPLDPSTIRIVDGLPMTRPVVHETVDNSTGRETVSSMVETIEPTRVVETTTIRDKTAQETNAEKTAQADSEMLRAFALVVLDEVNVMRAALDALGAPDMRPRTVGQMKSAIKAKL